MAFFDYVNRMEELGTPVAMVGLVIVALFLIVIIFKMLGGMFRGIGNKLLNVAKVLVSAGIAYGVAVWLSNHIIGALDAKTFESLFVFVESYVPGLGDALRNAMSNFDGELIEYILLLPATIILIPFITTALFLIINFILKIVVSIIAGILGFKRAKNSFQRLGGAILGAVEGIIWITMVMLPICGMLSLVDQAYQEAIDVAEDDNKTELVEIYDDYLLPLTSNPAISFINSVGADTMIDGIATVKIDEETANIREEILSIAHIIIVDANTLKGADFTAPNEDQKEALGSILDALSDSPIMSRVLIHGLHAVPSLYESGLIPINLGEDFATVLDDLMVFLKSTDRGTIGSDLDTIKDFYFGFCDSGIIAALNEGKDIMQFINDDYKGDKHILGMINTLSGNERTQGILDGLYNFVLNAAFAGASNGSEEEGALNIDIQDVKTGLNNIVSIKKEDYATEEEYKEELSNTIDTTINDTIGVDLEDEVVDDIADYVDENYSEQLEDLTDEEFNELMFEVIDIYQAYLNGEEINPDDLEGLLPGESQ